ncbi:hypothetical protein EDD15DRAFT_2199735 [Pisolithus albus]|nr:hypothetical protein EDD15DRAFT_2199735 [Pisolithus albus]
MTVLSSWAPSPDTTGEIPPDTSSIVTFAMTVANSYLPAIPVRACCHELWDGALKRNLMPYFAFTRNVHGKTIHVLDQPVIMSSICERASKSQVCAESTLILHLLCTGMETRGSLPLLLKTTLNKYHTKASLEYAEVTFDFGTQRKFDQWRAKAKKLGAKFGASDFKCKIIFITVHSEVTRGDLFAGKDEKGGDVAMRVEEFMSCLFSPPLEEVVYASTLFMLTCGPLVSFQESFMSMQQSIKHLWPEYTIAFTAPNFINAILKSFLISYSVQVLIEGHALGDVLQDLLNVSLGLLSLPKGTISVEACLSHYHPSHYRPSASVGKFSAYRVHEVCRDSSMGMIKA